MVVILVQHTRQGKKIPQGHITYTVHIEPVWDQQSPQVLLQSFKEENSVSKIVSVIPCQIQGILYHADKTSLEAVMVLLTTTAFNSGNVQYLREVHVAKGN